MNSHVVLGMVKKVFVTKSDSGSTYLSIKVLEKAEHDYQIRPFNVFRIIRYGTPEELEKEREKIAGGKSIYVSGTGIFDNTGKYYIVASEIYTLENADYGISINENSSNIDGSLEYLKAEYEKLKKD